jgi:hypothetical protein
VEEKSLPTRRSSREEEIRALGFDPRHLTRREQEELLEIYALCPDEALRA